MKVILGIGNPGKKYGGTRHNSGFRVVDALAAGLGATVGKKRFRALVGEVRAGGEKVLLVKPQTYVNESGASAGAALDYYGLEAADMLVVADEAALPAGRIRFKRSGSSAGHRGIESVIAHVGDGFHRLRIGIGEPSGEMIGHVLGRASSGEADLAERTEAVAVRACEDWLREGVEACMNRYNGMTIETPGSTGDAADEAAEGSRDGQADEEVSHK